MTGKYRISAFAVGNLQIFESGSQGGIQMTSDSDFVEG
jgi:hypothetical protein